MILPQNNVYLINLIILFPSEEGPTAEDLEEQPRKQKSVHHMNDASVFEACNGIILRKFVPTGKLERLAQQEKNWASKSLSLENESTSKKRKREEENPKKRSNKLKSEEKKSKKQKSESKDEKTDVPAKKSSKKKREKNDKNEKKEKVYLGKRKKRKA